MKKFILLLAITVSMASCAAIKRGRCYPPKGSKDWAAVKISAEQIAAAKKVQLIAGPERTMRGWKYTFLTATNDTVIKYDRCKYDGYTCFLIF
jgi:hypothetical protein